MFFSWYPPSLLHSLSLFDVGFFLAARNSSLFLLRLTECTVNICKTVFEKNIKKSNEKMIYIIFGLFYRYIYLSEAYLELSGTSTAELKLLIVFSLYLSSQKRCIIADRLGSKIHLFFPLMYSMLLNFLFLALH